MMELGSKPRLGCQLFSLSYVSSQSLCNTDLLLSGERRERVGDRPFLSWIQAEGAPSNDISVIRMHFILIAMI